MKVVSGLGAVLLSASLALPAAAQPQPAAEGVTVTSLLAEGYAVTSSFFNPQAGVVLLLQNGASLYMCLVQEMRDTAVLTTVYCKVVE